LGSDSKAFGYSDDLINAYDEKDADRFNLAVKNYLSYTVDNELLKLAQTITKTGNDWNYGVKAKPQPQQQQIPSSSIVTTASAVASSYSDVPITKFEDIVTDDEEKRLDKRDTEVSPEPQEGTSVDNKQSKKEEDDDDDIDLL
jgi:hypothetical protein